MITVYSSDDWILVKFNEDVLFSGHSVSSLDLVCILESVIARNPDCLVHHEEVSTDQMEVLSG